MPPLTQLARLPGPPSSLSTDIDDVKRHYVPAFSGNQKPLDKIERTRGISLDKSQCNFADLLGASQRAHSLGFGDMDDALRGGHEGIECLPGPGH